jgi:hypothetical protein
MEVSVNRKLTTKDIVGADREDHEPLPKAKPALGSAENPSRVNDKELKSLFTTDEEQNFRSRWQNIQTGFVDEPRRAVEQADELVAEIMHKLAQSFSDQRNHLESEWERSDKISTEELRLALRSYRSFFDRLLSI